MKENVIIVACPEAGGKTPTGLATTASNPNRRKLPCNTNPSKSSAIPLPIFPTYRCPSPQIPKIPPTSARIAAIPSSLPCSMRVYWGYGGPLTVGEG